MIINNLKECKLYNIGNQTLSRFKMSITLKNIHFYDLYAVIVQNISKNP
jgi:hypothetical protein